MSDKTIICKDCSTNFVFSEREQDFYKEKGFENEPQRCPECRKARKQQRRGSGFNSIGMRDNKQGRRMSNSW